MGQLTLDFDMQWSRPDSHGRPIGCEPIALTAELRDHFAINTAENLKEPRPASASACEGTDESNELCESGNRAEIDAIAALEGGISDQARQAILALPPRFWSKVNVGTWDECWPWKAGDTADGYGRIRLDGRLQSPHRAIMIAIHGEEAMRGMDTLHSCDYPPCCNPKHLSPGTRSQNMIDCRDKGRLGWRQPPAIDAERFDEVVALVREHGARAASRRLGFSKNAVLKFLSRHGFKGSDFSPFKRKRHVSKV